MNQRQNYINLLRTSKSRQATDFLREGTAYCALGLLCEMFRQETRRGEWNGPFYDTGKFKSRPAFAFKLGEVWCLELPCEEILSWAGLTQEEALAIQELNDRDRLSFKAIADRI